MMPNSQGCRQTFAPIVVFAYNRRDRLAKMMCSLQRCEGFSESSVIIFVDGPRDDRDKNLVEEVADFVRNLPYPNVTYHISENNTGLRSAIFSGVSRVIDEHRRIIVLEDDLVLSPIALLYFNRALEFYADDRRVWSISGYIADVKRLREFPRALILPYAHSWGWATWSRAWKQFDLDQRPRAANLKAASFKNAIDMNGFYPARLMLANSIEGRVNSWYAHWLYTIIRHGGRSVFPPRRVLDNYGTSAGTHGSGLNPHEQLVRRPPLLRTVPAFESADEIDYFAADLLTRCWEARVQRGVSYAGNMKRRISEIARWIQL